MNDLARQLIHDLRHDAHTREHFSIRRWSGNRSCATVGCIAGTAIIRARKNARWIGDSLFINNRPVSNQYDMVRAGQQALGLPTRAVARQLFEPWNYWQYPLYGDHADADFLQALNANERPDLSTVAKMIAWARNLPQNAYHPTHCANALENVLVHERLYVDWAEAWEPA